MKFFSLLYNKLRIVFTHILLIWKKSEKDMIFVHSASLTYTTFLNLIPVFAIAYYFFDFLGGFEQLQKHVESFISQNLAPQFADEILTYLEIVKIKISPKAIGAFGVVAFIISSIFLLSKIEYSLNKMWNISKSRSWTNKVTTYWTMISLGPIVIAISILASQKIISILSESEHFFALIVVGVISFIPYVFSVLLISGIYLWLPTVKIPWKMALTGGIIAAFLFEGLKQVYAFYAVYALKNSIYGTLAVLPVFMLWINLVWVVILFGAQVCYFLVERPDRKGVSRVFSKLDKDEE